MTDLGDNTQLVKRMLEDRLEEYLSDSKPGWIARKGKAYLHPDGERGKVGSFEVDMLHPYRGRWYRHSQAVGGWIMELFAYIESGEQSLAVTRATFDAARQWLGLPSPFGAGVEVDEEERAARRTKAEAEARERAAAYNAAAAQQRLQRKGRARDIWQSARNRPLGLVRAWLEERGLPGVAIPATIRCHPELPFWGTGGRRLHTGPAMVALITDGATARFGGVHITWLSADGRGKAEIRDGDEVLPARRMIGTARGGFVRLSPPGPHLAVGEGLESALSIQHWAGLPTFAALSLGNLGAALPPAVRSVTLCFDNDERNAKAAERLKRAAATAHASRGLVVDTCAPTGREDFNDMAMRMAAARGGAAGGEARP